MPSLSAKYISFAPPNLLSQGHTKSLSFRAIVSECSRLSHSHTLPVPIITSVASSYHHLVHRHQPRRKRSDSSVQICNGTSSCRLSHTGRERRALGLLNSLHACALQQNVKLSCWVVGSFPLPRNERCPLLHYQEKIFFCKYMCGDSETFQVRQLTLQRIMTLMPSIWAVPEGVWGVVFRQIIHIHPLLHLLLNHAVELK